MHAHPKRSIPRFCIASGIGHFLTRDSAADMLPRTGFLTESRSAPILGPGRGRPISNRFETVEPQGPADYRYELPDVEIFRTTGSRSTTRLGPGYRPGSPDVVPRPSLDQVVPHGCGANTFYTLPVARSSTAPRFGPGEGRSMSPQHQDLAAGLGGSGTDALYSVPPVDAYKTRQPRVPQWDLRPPRFPKTRKPWTDQQYTPPNPDVC